MRPSNFGGTKRKYIFALHGQPDGAHAHDREQQRGATLIGTSRPVTLAAVADAEVLLASLRAIRTIGGRGAGPEGVTYYELDRSVEYTACRETAQLLRCGSYYPLPPRSAQIKTIEGGQRMLTLRWILDRAVARAANSTVEPLIDRHFLGTSYGFRPGRQVLNILAALAVKIERGCRFLVVDKVVDAFENVRLDRVLPLVAGYILDPKLLSLIANILRGGERPEDHPSGIDPGSGLSPLTLNLQFHHALDIKLAAEPGLPVAYRHTDELAAACVTEEDAFRVIGRIRDLLQIEGHTLRSERGGVFRLEDGDEINLLGLQVQFSNGRFRLRTTRRALDRLKERLEDVWALPNPVWAAKIALLNWINYHGVGIRKNEEDELLNRIHDLTDQMSLQEALDVDLFRKKRLSAGQRWKQVLSYAHTGRLGTST